MTSWPNHQSLTGNLGWVWMESLIRWFFVANGNIVRYLNIFRCYQVDLTSMFFSWYWVHVLSCLVSPEVVQYPAKLAMSLNCVPFSEYNQLDFCSHWLRQRMPNSLALREWQLLWLARDKTGACNQRQNKYTLW